MSDQSQRIGRRDGRLAGLYRDHGGWLTRSLRRRFGDESDDIAHETWKRMVAFYGDAAEVRSPRALLLTIARRCAADLGRRRARVDETRSGLDWGDQGAAAAQDEALLLQQIILGLPEPLRYPHSVRINIPRLSAPWNEGTLHRREAERGAPRCGTIGRLGRPVKVPEPASTASGGLKDVASDEAA